MVQEPVRWCKNSALQSSTCKAQSTMGATNRAGLVTADRTKLHRPRFVAHLFRLFWARSVIGRTHRRPTLTVPIELGRDHAGSSHVGIGHFVSAVVAPLLVLCTLCLAFGLRVQSTKIL
jgi:hypothetical protein